MLRKISLLLLIVLYTAAGINHFINTQFYVSIMPSYIPAHKVMVLTSGIAEIILGLLLIPPQTRKWAAWLIAVMLFVFVPVHIFMLQQAYAVEGYRTSVLMAWIRLLLQPVLIVWVLWHARKSGR